jgi:hypothetical protein
MLRLQAIKRIVIIKKNKFIRGIYKKPHIMMIKHHILLMYTNIFVAATKAQVYHLKDMLHPDDLYTLITYNEHIYSTLPSVSIKMRVRHINISHISIYLYRYVYMYTYPGEWFSKK